MVEILEKYLPAASLQTCFDLIKSQNVHLKIVNKRKTRHGDYRQLPNGSHVITINAIENQYRFLITLIHEIAHASEHTLKKYPKDKGIISYHTNTQQISKIINIV